MRLQYVVIGNVEPPCQGAPRLFSIHPLCLDPATVRETAFLSPGTSMMGADGQDFCPAARPQHRNCIYFPCRVELCGFQVVFVCPEWALFAPFLFGSGSV